MAKRGGDSEQRQQPIPPSRQLPAEGGSSASIDAKIVTIRPNGDQKGTLGSIIRQLRQGHRV